MYNSLDIRYLDEVESWIKANNLSADDVCLVGSAALAANGIRHNNDLEIAIRPSCYKKLEKKYKLFGLKWTVTISENLELFKNQFSNIGVLDRDIFERKLYDDFQGYHVVILEVEYLYKKTLKREKDRKDILSIKTLYPEIDFNAQRYEVWYKGIFRVWNKIFRIIGQFYSIIDEHVG